MARQPIRRGARLPLPWERAQQPFRLFLSRRRSLPVLFALMVGGFFYTAHTLGDQRAELRATRATLAEVERATRAFLADLGRCPEDVSELVHPPKAGAHYLNELPVDGWGRPLYVRCPGTDSRDVADVISAGPSGSFLKDDHVL